MVDLSKCFFGYANFLIDWRELSEFLRQLKVLCQQTIDINLCLFFFSLLSIYIVEWKMTESTVTQLLLPISHSQRSNYPI